MSRGINIQDLSHLMKELDRYKKSDLNYYFTFVPGSGGVEFRVYDKGKMIGMVEVWDYGNINEAYDAIIKEFDRCESLYRSKLHKILE